MKFNVTLSWLILLSLISTGCAIEDILRVDLFAYENGSVEFAGNMHVLQGAMTPMPAVSDYKINFEDDQSRVLSTHFFMVSFWGGEPVAHLDRTNLFLKLPYNRNASNLIVYVNGSRTLTVSLDVLCNSDGVCSTHENTVSCPEDCPTDEKDGMCMGLISDGICDPDCPTVKDPDCMVLYCGDKGCNRWENSISCPEDCPVEVSDGYCAGVKDGICDPDCNMTSDEDCLGIRCPGGVCEPTVTNRTEPGEPESEGEPIKLWMVAFAIMIAIMVFVYYLDHRKSNYS